jgi:DNA repair protein RecO (recombination protein O)
VPSGRAQAPSAAVEAEALVLRTTPFGEADLVVHLLVRGRGRLGAFARGARRSQKRFAGGVEAFAHVRAELAERRGADLLELRGASVLEPHLALRDDLSRLAHAGYATELARELLHDRHPADVLLDLLLSFLARLCRAPARSLRLRAFELSALDAAGLAPQLDECARCGRAQPQAPWAFDALQGGLVCGPCAGPFALPVDPACVALLRALQQGGLDGAERAEDAGLPLEPARRALHAFLGHHVHGGLRSEAFLRDVGAPL